MRSCKDMATLLRERLTLAEFLDLQENLDSSQDGLYDAVSELAASERPDLFADDEDLLETEEEKDNSIAAAVAKFEKDKRMEDCYVFNDMKPGDVISIPLRREPRCPSESFRNPPSFFSDGLHKRKE